MRDKFHQHHNPSESAMKALWSDCHFVLDTSSLLNIYRYNAKTRLDFFKILKSIKTRLWIPHQAAQEFYNNRISVILDQKRKYSELLETLESSLKSLKDGKFSKSAFLDVENIEKIIKPSVEKARGLIIEQQSKHPELIQNDPYLDELVDIVDTNIGDEPNCDNLAKFYKDAEDRISNRIPPGYKDSQKPAPQRYGDILIWFEILKYSSTKKQAIIFITDDDKDDWWLKHEGKKLGPRPELREEFRKNSGQDFHIINPSYLLENAEKFLKITISKESIDNAKNVSNELSSEWEQLVTKYLHSNSETELSSIKSYFNKLYHTMSPKEKTQKAVLQWLHNNYENHEIYDGYGSLDFIIDKGMKTSIGVQILELIDIKYIYLQSTLDRAISKFLNNNDNSDTSMLVIVMNTKSQAIAVIEHLNASSFSSINIIIVVGTLDEYNNFIQIGHL